VHETVLSKCRVQAIGIHGSNIRFFAWTDLLKSCSFGGHACLNAHVTDSS